MIQDIEDHILLHGFKGKKPLEIKRLIDIDQNTRRSNHAKTRDEEEEEKQLDKRRGFLNMMRPPFVWNFYEEGSKEAEELEELKAKTPHVLRPDAEPDKCYIDGRVERLMEDIQQLGQHLTKHQAERWALLRKYTVEIFRAQDKKEKEEAANY